jgi:bacteriocin biosynthesis cyclodehydratase domain-containing protein
MFQRPRLKTFLTMFPISDTVWGVRGGEDELWRVTFRSPEAFSHLTTLLPMLNGAHTHDAIVTDMASKGIERSIVEQLLQRLTDAALLEEAETLDLPPEEQERHASAIAFFSRYTSEGGSAYQARLRAARVGLIANGDIGECLERQLRDAGIGQLVRLSGPDAGEEPPQLFVVVQDTDDTSVLEAMDTFSKDREIPWLLLRTIESTTAWVGPLFIPNDTACYLSLDARVRGNLPFFSEQQAFRRHVKETNGHHAPHGGLRAVAEMMASIATIEVTKYLSGFSSPTLAGRFLTLNFLTWEVELHEVLRVPGVGRDATQPDIFAWKEMPSDAFKGEGFEELVARRS